MIRIVRELLSDFSEVIHPSYSTKSFNPYLSVMLTIVTFTFIVYTSQFFITTVHLYAQNPVEFKNKVLTFQECNIFSQTSLKNFCLELTKAKIVYKDKSLLSFEQVLQSSTK